ncbi:neuronal acetylcholine receptor subunit beta-4-like [Branchiostoma lanceolatum]|uniref:neuronal acetylcholine receptor subunit beta-4-like n=1 Tax=Branchiostoma lanceolatum TaxID=7740 RepID=UPI003451D487
MDGWMPALVLLVITGCIAGCESAEAEERLVRHLFNSSTYSPLIRPALKPGDRITLKFSLYLSQLISVAEKAEILKTNVWLEQSWTDYRLAWEGEDYDQLTAIRVPAAVVWKPDIVLFNNKDGQFDVALHSNVIVYSSGDCYWLPPAIFQSSCAIDVRQFPFDRQNCSMKFGSWTYTSDEVDVVIQDYGKTAILDDFKASGEWNLLDSPSRRVEEGNEVYIYYDLIIERKPLFYIINLIIPCIAISSLSVLVFYLPSDCGEKITLSISVLLAMTVFLLLIADIIPSTSLQIPLIGKYLMFTMIFVTMTTVSTVCILNMHHRTDKTHEMPAWMRAVTRVLATVLRIQKPGEDEDDDEEKPIYMWDQPVDSVPMKKVRNGVLQDAQGRPFGSISQGSPQAPPRQDRSSPVALPPEMQDAVKNVKFIADHFKTKDEGSAVSDEWSFVALVIDRVCLWLFIIVCVLGTLGLFFEPLFLGNTG